MADLKKGYEIEGNRIEQMKSRHGGSDTNPAKKEEEAPEGASSFKQCDIY